MEPVLEDLEMGDSQKVINYINLINFSLGAKTWLQ